MGQANSRANDALNYVTITREKLLDIIIALNSRCEESLLQSNVNMIFAVEETGADKKSFGDIFKSWKRTVRIRCFSVMNDRTYSKSYTLFDFLKLYNSFLQVLDASDASQNAAPERADEHIMKMSIFQDEWCSIEGKCIICMDRKPNAVLPCAHAFCERCINAFLNIRQRCCPLCRHKLDSSSMLNMAAWEIIEKPVRDSINAYLVGENTAIDCPQNASEASCSE